ncbi:MAG: DUF814 domain-containing protein [Acidobacteria bacterium]|nr:DUF814 domain-containing protein [Acidobacteriota bacterium]
MDNAFLIPMVEELRASLIGATLGDVVQIDSRRFALRFSVPPFHRLCIAAHADLAAIYLAPRVAAPKEPTELAAVLSDRLDGAAVTAIRKIHEERIVEVDLADAGGVAYTLLVELLGKTAGMLLLDADRRIVRSTHTAASQLRRNAEGSIYRPPEARGQDPARPVGSRLLGRELDARVGSGESPEAAAASLAARMAGAAWAPCLYSRRPLEELAEADELPGESFFLAPFPLSLGAGLARADFARASDAARAWVDRLAAHLAFRDLRTALSLLIRGELEKATRLASTLAREGAAAADADSVGKRGELLLASLATARRDGAEVELVDYFDPGMPRVRIAIDPSLDLRENADALFRRAKKLKRASATIAARLADTRRRAEALRAASTRLMGAVSTGELSELEVALSTSGLVKVVRARERRESGRRPSFVRVREFRTGDGRVILVGRTAAENDMLTFKIASPHDYWFHAAGRAGAHVILRNPGRSKQVPESALIQAAAIAAWFSKGARDGDIDVHYCQRKEVRKGKGMPAGMVTLRNHRTMRVLPALPAGMDPEETG